MESWDNGGMLDVVELEKALALLEDRGLLREPVDDCLRVEAAVVAERLGVPFIEACSNDYLGYARGLANLVGPGGVSRGAGFRGGAGVELGRRVLGCESEETGSLDANSGRVSRETTRSTTRTANSDAAGTGPAGSEDSGSTGSGASRLLGGTKPEHIALETTLASWLGHESALLFSSGYAANVGLLSSLPREGDAIFSDSLNHASIIDGCRLSKATTVVFPHRDLDALRGLLRQSGHFRHRYIVSESYFSMDADTPNLVLIKQLTDEFAATLILDEAHALGIFGPKGAGLAHQYGIQPDITVGTLGKAVGTHGAFVAAPNLVRKWLWNRARSFIYSTATSPALAAQTRFHVKHVQEDDSARERLHQRAAKLRRLIEDLQLPTPIESHGPIVPVILGSSRTALAAARSLGNRGILAFPVRPPTVPDGSARLRLTVSAGMTDEAFAHLLNSIALCLRN